MLITKWKNYMQNRDRSPETIKNYTTDVMMMLDYLKKSDTEEDIKSITIDDIENFMDFLKNKRKNAPATICRRISAVQSFYDFLCSRRVKVLEDNIAMKLDTPKIPVREMGYLTKEEAQKLISVIDNDRDRSIVVLFLNTGLRLSELLSIKVDDIKDDSLTIIGKGNKERTIALNKNTIDCINNYLKIRPDVVKQDALFLSTHYKQMSKSTVQKMIDKYLAKIGRPDLSTHKLRHSFATFLVKQNIDIKTVSEILGHSNLSTTSRYLHVDLDQKRKAVASVDLTV